VRERAPARALVLAEEAVASADPREQPEVRARALLAAAWANAWRGRQTLAVDQVGQARRLFESRHDEAGLIDALASRGHVVLLGGEPHLARPWFEEALRRAEAADHAPGAAQALRGLANVHYHLGELTEAEETYGAALVHVPPDAEPVLRARIEMDLAALRHRLGQRGKPIAELESCREVLEREGDRIGAALCMMNLARIHRDHYDHPAALEQLREATEILRAEGDRIREARALAELSRIWSVYRSGEDAIEAAKRSLALSRELDRPYGIAEALDALGNALDMEGRTDEALDAFREAAAVNESLGNRKGVADCRQQIGDIHRRRGDTDEALAELLMARDIHEELGADRGRGWTLLALGQVRLSTGETSEGVELIEEANRIAEEMEYTPLLVRSLYALAGAWREAGRPDLGLERLLEYERVYWAGTNREWEARLENLKALHAAEQERKDAELTRLLNTRLRAKNEELLEANRKLSELHRQLNELMGVVVHDLRNPLSGIMGYAGMALRQLETEATDGVETSLTTIVRMARRMDGIVSGLLDLRAIETGGRALHPEVVELRAIVARILEEHRPRSEAKRIPVELAAGRGDVRARADRRAIQEIVDNLVSNALKFSPPDRRVEVRVDADGDHARVRVRDEGPGIPEGERENLFGKFSRLSAKPTGGETSTGLGLHVTKRLVEALGGRVECESEPGEGSTFTVWLPLAT
jgi:signal transduction histidine kinase